MQQSPFPKQSPEPHHHRDTTALIFGIVSLLFFRFPILPVGMGITAVIFARKSKTDSRTNHGIALSGAITGTVGICLGSISTIYWGYCLVSLLILLYHRTEMIPHEPEFPGFHEYNGPPACLRYWLQQIF